MFREVKGPVTGRPSSSSSLPVPNGRVSSPSVNQPTEFGTSMVFTFQTLDLRVCFFFANTIVDRTGTATPIADPLGAAQFQVAQVASEHSEPGQG